MNHTANVKDGEGGSFASSKQNPTKMLYIINFTSVRLALFTACSIAIVVFVFAIGFHLGNSKQKTQVLNPDETRAILMRDAGALASSDITDFSAQPSESRIIDMQTLSQAVEKPTSQVQPLAQGQTPVYEDDDYTASLTEELNAINSAIRSRRVVDASPNTTYTPPQQLDNYVEPSYSAPPKPVQPNTRTPYTASDAQGVVYFIQVAVGYNKDFSQQELVNLKKQFSRAFLKEDKSSDGRIMYKLKVGRYDTKADAERALSAIRKIPAYKDSYIYTDKKS